jgi:DNA-binding response OmpR family regulator/two-component sensor histidine kinase
MDMHEHPGEVLIVEDTPSSLKLLADLLASAGYAVRQAHDGELALWSAQARPPELILLDVRMPGIDGFEVCRRLKQSEQLRAIPVIFLSALSDTDDKLRGFEAGAIDFIGKPYQPEEVLARTGAHIALARSQRALAAANLELTSTLAQLNAAREELRRAERLAALGSMVAGIAHELNTPIGNCVLAASALEQRAHDFGRVAENGLRRSDLANFVSDTQQASALLLRNLAASAQLIDRFKQVATGQAGSARRRFDLAGLLAEQAASLVPRLRQAGVALQVDAAPGIEMDSYACVLVQVIEQLVFNAQLHGFPDGAGGVIRVTAERDGERFRLVVADNGAGIRSADLNRVFEPFFTTRMGQGSNGLGLHIVHNLVANVLGGTIEAESGAGETRLILHGPCCAPALADGQAA